MHRQLVFRAEEIELEMAQVAAALQPLACFSLVGDEAVETCSQKSLEAGLARVVASKMILLESVGKEALRQVFRVFVACLPFQADVFVRGFPVAGEDGVEGALPYRVVLATRCGDR